VGKVGGEQQLVRADRRGHVQQVLLVRIERDNSA
jgi:hypothetical protein